MKLACTTTCISQFINTVATLCKTKANTVSTQFSRTQHNVIHSSTLFYPVHARETIIHFTVCLISRFSNHNVCIRLLHAYILKPIAGVVHFLAIQMLTNIRNLSIRLSPTLPTCTKKSSTIDKIIKKIIQHIIPPFPMQCQPGMSMRLRS